jgi:pimeloyl-ACP methyl ester carboxylesterase
VHVSTHGQPDAPILLLVHGGGVAGWMWDRQVEYFSATHRVIIPDLPGHGDSRNQPYKTTRAATDALAEILLPYAGRKVTAVGFSLGGQVVIDLASRYPELLSSVVVVSALAAPMRSARVLSWFMGASAPLARWRGFARQQARALYISDSQFERYYETSTGISRESLAAVGRENYGFRVPEGWSAFPGPALILAGTREPIMLLRGVQALHERLPESDLQILEDAGHGISLQFPDRFNELLAEWLSRPDA